MRQASFDDTQEHYRSGTALINVSFAGTSSDEICTQALDAIKSLVDARFDTDNVKLYTEVGTDFSSTLLGEMLVIGALSVVTVIILLLLTSRSYAEVPVLLITFAMAAAIPAGNELFVLGDIICRKLRNAHFAACFGDRLCHHPVQPLCRGAAVF